MCFSCSNEYEKSSQWDSPDGHFRLQVTHCHTNRGHKPLNYIVIDVIALSKKKVVCHFMHDIPYGIASYRDNDQVIWSDDSQKVEAIFKHSDSPVISFSYDLKSGQMSFNLPKELKEGSMFQQLGKGVPLHGRDKKRLGE